MSNAILVNITEELASIPEDMSPDGTDPINPTFIQFYRGERSTLSFFHALRRAVSRDGVLSPKNLHHLLSEIVRERERCNIASMNTIKATQSSRIIVFGDLQGAAHSLARSLVELENLEIIDSTLTLKSDDDILVFNGNFIGRSHTNLETLAIILQLLANNKNVFVLQGQNEHQGEWRNFDLKNALVERAKHLSKERIPLESLVDRFLSTLLQELSITIGDKTIFITAERQAPAELLDKNLHAVITGINRTYQYFETNGLERLPSEGGLVLWSQFSAPTYINQRIYHFFNDAFCLLNCENYEYRLYRHDIRKQFKFEYDSYNFLSGHLSGIDERLQSKPKIFMGVTMDLSETASVLGMRLREGIESAVNHYNEGNNSYALAPIILNDRYTPFLSTQNIRRFREHFKTDIIFSPVGTPTTAACLPLVLEKEILVLFPYSGASIFRKPNLENIVHLRASYAEEARALLQYADQVLQLRRFAFFYQNDAYGIEPLNAATEILSGRTDIEFITASYMRNNPTTKPAAAKIIEFDPECIFFFSTFAPSCALIHEINIDRLAGKFLFGISFLTDVIRTFCHKRGLDFTISRVTPNHLDRSIPIVDEFYQTLNRQGRVRDFSVDALEGFVTASLLGEIINQTAPDTSKEAILSRLQSLKNYNFKGLTLTYNKNTKELFDNVWVDLGVHQSRINLK